MESRTNGEISSSTNTRLRRSVATSTILRAAITYNTSDGDDEGLRLAKRRKLSSVSLDTLLRLSMTLRKKKKGREPTRHLNAGASIQMPQHKRLSAVAMGLDAVCSPHSDTSTIVRCNP
jgi:hypothetical protein